MASAKEKLIASAQKLVEKGAFEKAIKEYLRVVQEDESDVRIWLKIGGLYAKIGKKTEATETYQRVAKFYSDQGFYLKSVAVYKQILALEPRLVEVNQRLADLYKQLGLISDAIHQFEQIAAFFHKEGKVREALAAMKQIVDLDPETVAARIKLAEMYSRENMPREAIDEFTKAAEQLKEQGRVDEYMKVAERLLFHAPDNKPVTKELARMYIEKNDPRRALPKLQILFKADARDLDVLRLLARAFEGLEQRPKAVSVYKEAARILTEQGDQRGAADVFEQILAIEPEDADAQAALRNQKGRGERARKPTPPPAPNATGSQRAMPAGRSTGQERALDAMPVLRDQPTMRPGAMGATDDALMPPESAESSDVVNEEIAKILSETDVYIKYNLHAKAIEHLQRVFERAPRHIGAREKLKALYITTGRKEEAILELWALAEAHEPQKARRYVREIYELDPNDERAAQILGEPVGGQAAPVEEEVVDDFGVEVPSDFGLPSISPRRDDPPTRRGRALDAVEPMEADAISEEVAIGDDEIVEEVSELEPLGEPLPFDDDEPKPEDDDIPVVVDEGAHPEPAHEVQASDHERFSLSDDEPSVTHQAPPSYETSEPDAETRYAGGPRGIAAAPAGFDTPDEGTGTDQMDVEELASFDDPSAGAAAAEADPVLEPAPMAPMGDPWSGPIPEPVEELDSSDLELKASPPSGSGRRPAPAPIPDPISPQSNLEDDLDEADFFMQQNLLEEARALLASLSERFPEHPLVQAKLRDLEAMEREAAGEEPPPLEPMQPGNSISAELPNDLPGSGEVHAVRTDETPSGQPVEVTRRGVIERGVSAEDFETHYDLGIAYKEMGLIDNAVAEFRIVMKDPTREVQCLLMIGLCYIEKQQFTEAINQFKKGLYVDGITDAEALSLYYELGQSYEKVGDPREALYYYDKVQKRDPKFRDLARRLRALRAEEPEVEPASHVDVDGAFDSLLEEG